MNDLYSIEEIDNFLDLATGIKIKTNQLTNLREVKINLCYIRLIIEGEFINSLEGYPNFGIRELILHCPNLKSLEGIKYPEYIEILSLRNTQISDFSILVQFKRLRLICLKNYQDVNKAIPFLSKIKIEAIFTEQPERFFYIRAYKPKYKYGIKLLISFLIKKKINQLWQKFFYPTRFSFVAFSEMISN